MSDTLSKRRMGENEIVFRDYNERIKKGYDSIKELATADQQEELLSDHDFPLFFYCECADEKCIQRIKLKPSLYNKIHERRDYFIIVPGHQVDSIESIVSDEKSYSVVKKHIDLPETVSGLNPTNLSNA